MFQELAGFAVVAAGMMIMPGADFAVVTRNSAHGRAAGLSTALGVAGGLAFHTGLAVMGLATLLAASPALFATLKVIGGGYLLYLGYRTLHSALRRRDRAVENSSNGTANRPFLQGFLTNASNPKAPLLFLSLLPQFVPDGAPVVPWTLLLSVIAVCLGLIWFATVAILVDRIAAFVGGESSGRAVDIVMGFILLALGAALMVEAIEGRF